MTKPENAHNGAEIKTQAKLQDTPEGTSNRRAHAGQPSTPTLLENAKTLFADVQKVIDLVASVVAKFPRETLPATLHPFATHIRVWMMRPPSSADEIIIAIKGPFDSERTVRIPAQWLTMQQSEVAAAVRALYWDDARNRQVSELAEMRKRIDSHSDTITRHTKQLEQEREAYNALAKRIDKANHKEKS